MAQFIINGANISITKRNDVKKPYIVWVERGDGRDSYFVCTLPQLTTLANGIVAYVNKESNVKPKTQARTKRNG